MPFHLPSMLYYCASDRPSILKPFSKRSQMFATKFWNNNRYNKGIELKEIICAIHDKQNLLMGFGGSPFWKVNFDVHELHRKLFDRQAQRSTLPSLIVGEGQLLITKIIIIMFFLPNLLTFWKFPTPPNWCHPPTPI